MRRKLVVLAGVCLLPLLNPTPAHAIFGGGWLERLSGPGPFTGFVAFARLVCISGPAESNNPQENALDDERALGRRVTFPRDSGARLWLTGAGCHFLPVDQPRMEFGIEGTFLRSNNNLLDYSDRELTENQKQVKLRTFVVTADLRVNRVLDVGAGLGQAWFSSSTGLFTDFTRTVLQPLRLTTRPLATVFKDRRAAAVVVLFDATKFHKGFTAEDFGARQSTYNEPAELVWSWQIRGDVMALFWRR